MQIKDAGVLLSVGGGFGVYSGLVFVFRVTLLSQIVVGDCAGEIL